ncbi:hypothetical protein FLAG1_10931 [Fusarium langsethiae]|uniref:Uncharacterized protein n=1 Tax=Fusarium langsethiae TaxID=179993 RepID=A0A0M9EMW5_FUSLA|nr:hypothetical protein FLAG1_10931 [Fusarium langsethiae]GKU06528.1 unnamed protein product [Fusarium langsethiae]GKU20637.1 unnamed protein product [Fusarium langsethiae]
MCEQPRPEQQQNVDQKQNHNGCRNCTGQAKSNGNYQYQETFSVPAPQEDIEPDYDHRSMITIQSQQRQWPQDIWFESPTQRVLYHPTLVWDNNAPQDISQDTAPTKSNEPNTNQDETKGSSA